MYAKLLYKARRDLWSMLSGYAFYLFDFWIVIRDFNVVLDSHGKMGLAPICICCEEIHR